MSYRELFVSPPPFFSGFQKPLKEAEYVVLGVPFDATSTFRAGARFAPLAIREALLGIEGYSFRSGVDAEDLKVHDLGDLHISGELQETLKRLELVTKELLEAKKLPVFIGGEHTITLGAMRSVGGNAGVVSFDAHLDLRNEFMGLTISHTTWMQRLHEQVRPEKILEVGTRAVDRDELNYAKEFNIPFFTVHQIMEDGVEKTAEKIRELLAGQERIYLTIDMDVLDPAFAPAVQNPEPDGLSIHVLLDLLCSVCDRRVVAFDLVEVAPHYDMGITATQAAKTILEVLCHLERARKG
ncbi:MAG: agmatinase [Candidatus Bathyarchaeota archaeon]|nr:agmatinase [Candidatus Bathyarchaeota archaeon]MDH5713724.1 agmatinase [Candidatus Bathyarchaeota archaeon]